MNALEIYDGILDVIFGNRTFNDNQWDCVDEEFEELFNAQSFIRNGFIDKRRTACVLDGRTRKLLEAMFRNSLKDGYKQKSSSAIIFSLNDFLVDKFFFHATPLLSEHLNDEDEEARRQTAYRLFRYVLTSLEGKKTDAEINTDVHRKLMETCLNDFVTRDTHPISLSAQYDHIHPVSGKYYCERDYLRTAIDKAFEDDRIVFISGLSGIGKSELCRHYGDLKQTNHEIDRVIPLILKEDGSGNVDYLKTQIHHSHEALNATEVNSFGLISERDLVILDNYNDYENVVLENIIDLIPYSKILVTTQVYSDDMDAVGTVIQLEKVESRYQKARNQFAVNVFCRYANIKFEKCSKQEKIAIESVLKTIGYHTMITALLGRQYKTMHLSILEYCQRINTGVTEALALNIRVSLTKDSIKYTKSPYELVKLLFKHRVLQNQFTEIERQVLGAIILCEPYTSNMTLINYLVGDREELGLYESKSCMYNLHEQGLINIEYDNVYIHPLLQKLLEDTIADVSFDFHVHLLKNRMSETYSFLHPEILKYKNEKSFDEYKSWFNSLLKTMVLPRVLEENPKLKDLMSKEAYYWCSCRSKTGSAVFLHFESGKDICILDANNQKLSEYRYFNRDKEYPVNSRFESCNLIQFHGHVPEVLVLPSSVANCPVEFIGSSIFAQNSKIRKVILPIQLKIIPKYAFCGCSHLEEIVFPNTLVSIGPYAFYGCKKLKNIKLNNCLKQISIAAFSQCHSLEGTLELPEKLEIIQRFAFSECDHISKIHMKNEVIEIGQHAFNDCQSLETITISTKLGNMPLGAFQSCKMLKEIVIPGSVKSLDENLFYNCSALTRVIIEEGVQKIRTHAFYKCPNLAYIKIPQSVTFIGKAAIKNCPKVNIDAPADSSAAIQILAYQAERFSPKRHVKKKK